MSRLQSCPKFSLQIITRGSITPPKGAPLDSRSGSHSPLPGTKSARAHKWADWLHNPCRPGGPQRYKGGNKIRSGPQVGRLATSPLLSQGSRLGGPQRFTKGDKIAMWPTSGQIRYITPAVWGGPQCFRAGDTFTSGPQVGK